MNVENNSNNRRRRRPSQHLQSPLQIHHHHQRHHPTIRPGADLINHEPKRWNQKKVVQLSSPQRPRSARKKADPTAATTNMALCSLSSPSTSTYNRWPDQNHADFRKRGRTAFEEEDNHCNNINIIDGNGNSICDNTKDIGCSNDVLRQQQQADRDNHDDFPTPNHREIKKEEAPESGFSTPPPKRGKWIPFDLPLGLTEDDFYSLHTMPPALQPQPQQEQEMQGLPESESSHRSDGASHRRRRTATFNNNMPPPASSSSSSPALQKLIRRRSSSDPASAAVPGPAVVEEIPYYCNSQTSFEDHPSSLPDVLSEKNEPDNMQTTQAADQALVARILAQFQV